MGCPLTTQIPTSRQLPDRRRWFEVGAAGAWTVAGVSYLVLEAVAADAFRPRYSYARNYISDLGVTAGGDVIDSPLAWLMNVAFYLQGTLFLVAAVLFVHALRSRRRAVFLTCAAMNSVGNIVVGTFHSGPQASVDGTAWLHVTGAVLAIVGGNAAIVAGSWMLGNAGGPKWYRAASLVIAAAGLLCFVMLGIDSRTTAFQIAPDGVWERGSVYSIIGWQLLTAGYLLGRRRASFPDGAGFDGGPPRAFRS